MTLAPARAAPSPRDNTDMSEAASRQEALIQALHQVREPDSGRDVLALGWVHSASLHERTARVVYALPAEAAAEPLQKQLREQTIAAVRRLDGVDSLAIEFAPFAQRATNTLPGVKHVIAVGAGKGGVGKSTVATLLAFGLVRRGQRAGLLDADVYGPSIPKLTGTEDAEPAIDGSGYIIPPQRDGVPIMSMGYLVPPDQAVVWRGPMAQKYVKEFLDRGRWGELDYLLVDLPPGTGDVPLTLAQSIPLTGSVVVCTPQDVALLDAVKALRMYQKLGVEPLGIVENMSFYICPQCGHREHIFDHGGCQREAQRLGVPFLGGIPLHISIRRSGDEGKPQENFTSTEPYVIEAISQLVERLVEEVERRVRQRIPLPQLRVR
jgi:ATP-binding protein involved in chromosome partitioning